MKPSRQNPGHIIRHLTAAAQNDFSSDVIAKLNEAREAVEYVALVLEVLRLQPMEKGE